MTRVIFLMMLLAQPAFSAPDAVLQFAKSNISVDLKWESGPVLSEEAILRLDFKNALDQMPVEPKSGFKVSLFMPNMGHGSAPTAVQRIADAKGEIIPGAFRVSNIYFTMGGYWEVHLLLKGISDELQMICAEFEDDGLNHLPKFNCKGQL